MKKYDEVLEEMKENRNELYNLKKEIEKTRKEEKDFFSSYSLKEKVYNEDLKIKRISYDEKIDCLSNKIYMLEIKSQILRHNLKHSIYNDFLPIVIDVLKKYENKRMGEKTQEKIKNEIFEKIGFNVYISNNEINFYNNNTYISSFKVYSKNKDAIISNENKLKSVSIDELYFFNQSRDFIENIDEYIRDMMKAFDDVKKKEKELNELINVYNNYCVENIDTLYINCLKNSIL